MKTLDTAIQFACNATPAFTPARRKALSQIKWRMRFGLLYAGLKDLKCVLVSKDDPCCLLLDGRDNQDLKLRTYGAALGCAFEIEMA
jgi:hypothetical protein